MYIVRRMASKLCAVSEQFLFLVALVALVSPPLTVAQSAKAKEEIRVTIEANEWNRPRLLEKLNQHGAKDGMKFVSVEDGYQYKIQFETGKTPELAGQYDTGFAVVYDSQGRELFKIAHEAWLNEAGAINGTAKNIVKRLREMNSKREP
jgi:hypothetical protein